MNLFLFKILESVNRILEINEIQPLTEFENIIPLICPTNFTLRLSNLFFSYPSRPDMCVLNGISLDIPFGSAIGIIF